MKKLAGFALVLGTLAGIAARQDGEKIELLAQNREVGVEIRAPKSPGKEQMWEAKAKVDGFHKGSAVLVKHRADPFTVEVNVSHKGGDPMSDDMESSWPKPSTIAEKARQAFTDGKDDKGQEFTECRVVSEDSKVKLAGLPGSGYSHRLLLTDKKGEKRELVEYFVISSNALYRVTVSFTKESYEKYWARDGQAILGSIRRCKIEKK
jgi:hypothetical protein